MAMAAFPELNVPVESHWPRVSVSGDASFSSRMVFHISSALTAPGVLIVGLSKEGRPGSFRVYAIQPDGDHQIETASYFNPDGTPYTRYNYFTRVK